MTTTRTKIQFGVDTTHIQDAASMIIGMYFDYNDYGENLEAYLCQKDRRGLSHIFGDKPFIRFNWDGPNRYGVDQIGQAMARVFDFVSEDEKGDEALSSLFELGSFFWGYREVLKVNDDFIDICSAEFDEEEIRDLVHYVNTQKSDPSKQNRVFVKITPACETTSRYSFVVVDQNMGYGY